tara:strand:+ start:3010 stop:4161 length:1152 start_codon:yes stop_codon:yes gene_type:complete
MPSSWIQPVFIYSLIFDVASYIVLSCVFFVLFKKKIINNTLLFFSLFFLLTPFLFNGFLFDWSKFPDQSKYLNLSYNIRNNPELILSDQYYSFHNIKFLITSSIYAFSPILSLETYIGVSLVNRSLFLLTLIFFINKRLIDNYNSILFLLAPSLILYTSIALRDTFIIILMFWFLYFFYIKNYFYLIITFFLLILLRFPIITIIFTFIFFSLFIENNRINYKKFTLLLLLAGSITFFYNERIIYLLNFYREGFFAEEFGHYISVSNKIEFQKFKLGYNLSSVLLAINGFYNFMLPPFLKGKINLFYFIQFLEGFAIFSYLYLRIKFQKNLNYFILFKWILIYVFSYFIYSLIIFNDGTIHRYKIPILFFVIFGYFVNIKKEKV